MNFDTTELTPQNNYRLLTGGITPRPIAWISTCSASNIHNIAPYSFFSVASCNPPVLSFTEVKSSDKKNKGTLSNLRETGECVVNIVTETLLEKMNQTSANVELGQSKFDMANIEHCPSHRVKPYSVKLSPIRYECTLREVIEVSNAPTGGTIVLLDVKSIFIQNALYNQEQNNVEHALVESVGKMGGDYFTLTNNKVEIKRP